MIFIGMQADILLMGNTENNQIWEHLDSYLSKWWRHESGQTLPISMTLVDSGFLSKKVYEFCRFREHKNIYPVKGSDGWGRGYLELPTGRNKYGVIVIKSFVDEIKNKLYTDLMVEDTTSSGYCNFPISTKYDDKYFKMLTSESLEKVYSGGKSSLKWILPKGRRNEALDCRVYAFTALQFLNPNFDMLPVNQLYIPAYGKTNTTRRRVMSKGF
jgi:phage terminase large subunit GpA-like protein